MKLFTKYNRINLIVTVIIFLLGSIAFSFLLRYVVIKQIDEDLKIEKNEIVTFIRQHNHLPEVIKVHDQYTTYKAVNSLPQRPVRYYTEKIKDKRHHDDEIIRTISFDAAINNQAYRVYVSKSLEGTDDLIQSIIVITLAIIILILTSTFIINRTVLRRLWKPFYESLQQMRGFKLGTAHTLHFSNSSIEEFDLMNTTLKEAVNKAQHDYLVLKEFTENASHELQTPLAVIRSKLDLLIQDEQLSEPQSKAIQSAYDAVENMKRLNQSLLLLTKIENRQFPEQEVMALDTLLEIKLVQFHELWQSRNIAVTQDVAATSIRGNPQLTAFLLNNLLSNATRHNISNGAVHVLLQPALLQISNTGNNGELDKAALFNRFYKTATTGDHHGLGLSIVKQICEVSGYSCTYHFQPPNRHVFSISW